MGILNVTPDAFSDGGNYFEPEMALRRGLEMIQQGVDIIDVGGESTRPGAQPVSVDEELTRVIPVVKSLSEHARVSIDTRRAEVAEMAVDVGASIINDVSASLYEVAAQKQVTWVAMHMQGNPLSMQDDPHYDNVVDDVSTFLFERADMAKGLGVPEVWIDPGIGFGKTIQHNLALLQDLEVLTKGAYPVVVGTSRKRFLGAITEAHGTTPEPMDRLEASLATACWAITKGASVVRVHDVNETVRVVQTIDAIRGAQ